MKQPDLHYFESIKMTSQGSQILYTECEPQVSIPLGTLTRLVTSFLWLQNSMDQAVS